MTLTLEDLLQLNPYRTINAEALQRVKLTGVSTDSRTTKKGDVFFAIRGDKFNGHQFVASACERGALCAVVDERAETGSLVGLPLIVVHDTTQALGQLARIYRSRFAIPVIAIAGSNGKTTTKDMIGAVLGRKYTVLKTEGNLNNHIGVPQTVFRLAQRHEVAVIEVGSNHPGEVSYLCSIVEPTHALVTNIGREHLEFFRDLDGAAKEEGSVFAAIGSKGIAFVNADDPRVVARAKPLKMKLTYGFSARGVQIRGKFQSLNERGCAEFSVWPRGKREFAVTLAVPGAHTMRNALAAAAVGIAFEVPIREIQRALVRFRASSKRMEILKVAGVTVLNDTYNANPDSVLSALETLQAMMCRGKKIAVLADMLELGEQSEEEHRKIGERAGEFGFDYLLTYGPFSKFTHEAAPMRMKFHYEEKNVLSEYLAELVSPGDLVLVKGSRGMKMEDVVTFLESRLRSVSPRMAAAFS